MPLQREPKDLLLVNFVFKYKLNKENVIVIGAGLTGLSFAYHFNINTHIYEMGLTVGGLVKTISWRKYNFDVAPHLLHIKYDYVKKFIVDNLGLTLKSHKRNATIYIGDRIIDYPFELNLYGVNNTIKRDCLNGLNEIDGKLRKNDNKLRTGSYKEYALKAFGAGIANHYLLPYNKKIWDTDPSHLTCDWMRHLPTADIDLIRNNADFPGNVRYGYNTDFLYPVDYGIQELPDAMATTLTNLNFKKHLIKINAKKKILTFQDGEKFHYEKLISTIPLTSLIKYVNDPLLMEISNRLRYTTVYVVNFIIDGNIPKGIHWMYFPEPEISFYRASFPKNYFKNASPNSNQIISVEIGSKDHSLSKEYFLNEVKKQVLELGIFKINRVVATYCYKIPVAYCIYDFNRQKIVSFLRDKLKEMDIFSVGRYGAWEYGGMEDAIMTGKELAEEIKKV